MHRCQVCEGKLDMRNMGTEPVRVLPDSSLLLHAVLSWHLPFWPFSGRVHSCRLTEILSIAPE
jgi:hypothetical protein